MGRKQAPKAKLSQGKTGKRIQESHNLLYTLQSIAGGLLDVVLPYSDWRCLASFEGVLMLEIKAKTEPLPGIVPYLFDITHLINRTNGR